MGTPVLRLKFGSYKQSPRDRVWSFVSTVLTAPLAAADVTPRDECIRVGEARIESGKRYICVKARKSLNDPLGHRLIRSLGKAVDLESLRSGPEILTFLNKLGLGYWERRKSLSGAVVGLAAMSN